MTVWRILFFLIYFINIFSQDFSFVLITSLYNETDKERLSEYVACLDRNIKHSLIDVVHVIYDISKDKEPNFLLDYLKSLPIKISYETRRPTYEELLKIASDSYPSSIIILCNADIYFNETLFKLETFDFTHSIITLTRWNDLGNGDLELEKFSQGKNYMSSDAWIFRTPCKIVGLENVGLGTWQCDGLFHLKALCSGFSLYNLCYDVRACHMHASQKRNYKQIPVMGFNDVPEIPWKKISDFKIYKH